MGFVIGSKYINLLQTTKVNVIGLKTKNNHLRTKEDGHLDVDITPGCPVMGLSMTNLIAPIKRNVIGPQRNNSSQEKMETLRPL